MHNDWLWFEILDTGVRIVHFLSYASVSDTALPTTCNMISCVSWLYKDYIWYNYYISLNFVKAISGNIKHYSVFSGLILELIMNAL